MSSKSVCRRSLPGKFLNGKERDTNVLHNLRNMMTVAGTCRRSGAPETGVQILRGVFPVLLMYVHRRFVGGRHAIVPGAMVDELFSGGHINEEDRKRLTDAAAGLSEFGTGRDITNAMLGCMKLWKIVCSERYRTLTDEYWIKPPESSPRPSLFRRWATAAATVLTLGASSS